MAVEKLICERRSQLASHQDALQTIFSRRLGIFYPQNHAVFVDIDFFNTHACHHQLRLYSDLSFIRK